MKDLIGPDADIETALKEYGLAWKVREDELFSIMLSDTTMKNVPDSTRQVLRTIWMLKSILTG